MSIIGSAIVQHIHIVVRHQIAPIGVGVLVAIALRGGVHGILIAPGDADKTRNRRRRIHHVRDLLEGVGMRLAHEGVTQHTDAKFRRFGLRGAARHAGEGAADLFFFGHHHSPNSSRGNGCVYSSAKAASKATSEAVKSLLLTQAADSVAPNSRSMPLSSHSTESGP